MSKLPSLIKTENKLKSHDYVCKNHGYYYIEMPKEDILKYNIWETFMKTAFIICADPESLLIIILKSHQQLR